jgi:CMP-2-keto-3-deoxyoctulosonic acid synthetase
LKRLYLIDDPDRHQDTSLRDDTNEIFINGDFHLMKESDIPSITEKLNQFNHCYQVAPWMDDDQTKNFLLPRKYVVYTLVKRNNDGVTDMISFYYYYMHLHEDNEKIVVAHLGMYFFATMTMEQMINSVKSNLKYYEFDQISYHEYGNCEKLNLVSYETNHVSYYTMHGCNDIVTDLNAFSFIPL